MNVPAILILLLLTSAAAAQDRWDQFRGSTQMGHAPTAVPPLRWSESQNVRWKTAVPGQGWSSPVVLDGQVWMTTATEGGKSLRAVCVELSSGRIQHDVEVFRLETPEKKNGFNSHASPTPFIEKGRVYVSFGNSGSACLDTAGGKVIWTNRELRLEHKEGAGSSPIVWKDLFILDCDGTDVQYIAALRKDTGQLAWKVKRSYDFARRDPDVRKAYCTPIVVPIGGQDRLISVGASRVYCYDPADGRELWHCNIPGFSVAPRPVFGDGIVYVCTGYMKAELYAIRTEAAAGDISNTHVPWTFNQGVPLKPSLLLIEGRIHMLSDGGILRCLDAKTGTQLWQKRIPGAFSAAPLYANGHVYCFSENGPATVYKPAAAAPEMVAENSLESGCIAAPAAVGKALIVRTRTSLYRLEE